jgi:hypothetical protein
MATLRGWAKTAPKAKTNVKKVLFMSSLLLI